MSRRTRSILRYPGSKARFVEFISSIIELNKKSDSLFAEPFCGGASVSIALLENNIVEQIAINDVDPLIASFWNVVFCPIKSEWLIEQILTIPLTLDEWRYQKDLEPDTPEEAALKCLYLNRTSFNGILHKAGPIGGWKQKKRTLDARFNREKLDKRVKELSFLRERIVSVSNNDWQSFCDRLRERHPSIFFYFDPPYYYKAEKLYGYYFSNLEHEQLRDYLISLQSPWMLSYDDVPEIRKLYHPYHKHAKIIDSTYSTHPMGGASFIGRELFFSNLPLLSSSTKGTKKHIGISIRKYKNDNEHKGLVRLSTTQFNII